MVKFGKRNGYDATRFHKIYDGAVYTKGDFYDYPINELVINPGNVVYSFPHGTPKYKLWKYLPVEYQNTGASISGLPAMFLLND